MPLAVCIEKISTLGNFYIQFISFEEATLENAQEITNLKLSDRVEHKVETDKIALLTVKKTAGKLGARDILPKNLSLNGFFEKTISYNNNYDRDADKFTADAKSKYIQADRDYFRRTGKNMSIHSGRRTVERQAELFIRYKWHNQGNPASWPGCSFHNWGVAADMIRTDEANVVAAMKSGGWTRTVGDEGWHFECTSSNDHKSAAGKIKAFRTKGSGLAYKWAEQVANFYIKSRDFEKRAPVFNSRLQNHQQTEQVLQNDIDAFNRSVSQQDTRVAAYNSDANRFNGELERSRRLLNEINSLPNGPERNRKIREYNALASWLSSESDRLDRESVAIDRENNRLASESNKLDVRVVAFQKEDNWLNVEYAALTKLEKEITGHEAAVNKLLKSISAQVK